VQSSTKTRKLSGLAGFFIVQRYTAMDIDIPPLSAAYSDLLEVDNAKPAPDKAYKLQDETSCTSWLTPNGSKYFRYHCRFNGKRKILALGIYPTTSLKEAREKRDTAKKQIDGGIDPSLARKIEKGKLY